MQHVTRRTATRWFTHLTALLILLLTGLLLDASLQLRPTATLDVGGRDLGYVQGFSAKEWSETLPGTAGPLEGTYRWMGASGTLLVGPLNAGQPILLHLRMFSGRPAEAPWPEVYLEAGPAQAAFALAPTLHEYSVLLPPEALRGNTLLVALRVDTFQAPNDPRDLGLVVESVRLERVGETSPLGPSLAALRPTYTLAGLAVALGALALGVAFWPACGLGAGLLALVATGTALRPEIIVRAGPTVTLLLMLAAAVVGALRLLGRRWKRWARWLGEHAAVVLLVVFLLTMLTSFFPHIEADGIEYYAYLRSLAFDGDLHFANELSLDTPFPHIPYGLGAQKTATGYEPNYASVGPAIVWIPFFAVGHLLALGGNALGLPWSLDGYSEPYVVLICFGSTLSALVTLLLGYDLVRRLYGRSMGLLATVATFFGTSLFYYAFYKPDFAHALAACAVMAFVSLWVQTFGKRTLIQWLWLGLVAGFMSTLYWIDALFVVLPALELGWMGIRQVTGYRLQVAAYEEQAEPGRESRIQDARHSRPETRSEQAKAEVKIRGTRNTHHAPRAWLALGQLLLHGGLFAAAFLVAFSPQMLSWKILYGQWFTIPQEGFATPSGLAVMELLLSPLHGLLPWTPLAVAGLIGLLWLAWKKRPWGAMVLVGMAVFFLYNATLYSWHGGGYFGLRRLTGAFPFFLLGVAAFLDWIRRWRPAAAIATALLSTFWGLAVLLRYLVYTIPHYPQELEGLSLGEFLLSPDNIPLSRVPEVLQLSFFVQWAGRLVERFHPAELAYGVVLIVIFVLSAWAVWRGMTGRREDKGTG
jgi:hypothetical protein